VKTSVIFKDTLDAIPKSRRIIHQGGQYSGKTVNILAALATVAAQSVKTITVTSKSFPHLRAGAMRDFERYVLPEFSGCIKQHRKSDHITIFNSGAVMEFKTYETEFDARGPKRDILFINEANTFDYMTWWQLDSRSEVSIIDYNPTVKFWAHEKVKDEPGTVFFRSWHEHNPFLSERQHADIEGIKDPELWKVYARGVTGNVRGLIFPDWEMVDILPFEEPFFAIDFGYTNDPTAIVKMELIKHSDLYVEELAYKTGAMTAKRINELLISHGYDDNSVVYCEHDPHIIQQLKQLDVRAVAAKKGDGSVKAGIEKLKEYNVYYQGRHIKEEKEKYIWVVDEMGNPTNKPLDGHNHLLDAIRYGAYTHYYRT